MVAFVLGISGEEGALLGRIIPADGHEVEALLGDVVVHRAALCGMAQSAASILHFFPVFRRFLPVRCSILPEDLQGPRSVLAAGRSRDLVVFEERSGKLGEPLSQGLLYALEVLLYFVIPFVSSADEGYSLSKDIEGLVHSERQDPGVRSFGLRIFRVQRQCPSSFHL